MSRGVGFSEAIRETFAGVEPVFALLTQLGDVWFLVGVTLVAFWLGPVAPLGQWDRRRALVLVAVGLCAVAATGSLKAVFELPRPAAAGPAETHGLAAGVYESAASATGYGFPSGHAIGSTAVYGTAALLVDRGRRGTRLAIAGILVGLVSLSRVALGVHFVVDVGAGIAVGLVLVVFARILADRPSGLLELTLLLSVAWIAAVGFESDPLTVLGVAAGLWVAWWRYGTSVQAARPAPRTAALTVGVGIALLGPTLAYAGRTARGGTAVAMGVVAGLGIVALPLAVGGEKTED